MTKVAIITLNYNGKKNTLELLKSLKLLKAEGFETKVIMVDNASSDGSVWAIRKKFEGVDILQTGENLGFGAGYNKGLEYATIWGADYFLLINNDSKIGDPYLLQKLIEVAKKDPKIGVVAPKILFEKGYEFFKDRYSPSQLGKVIWYAGGHFDWDNIASVHRGIDKVDDGQYDFEEEVSFFSGACFLVKKEALDKVCGFEGKFFLYFEDAHLAKRVIEAGFKIYYIGHTFIYHKVSQSTGIGSVLSDYYHTRNRLIFGMDVGGLRTKLALLREAVKLLLFGRMAQRNGVLDYFLGKNGKASSFHTSEGAAEYPLKLSIGIVNYNTASLTRKLLESIFKRESGFDSDNMEVIVLDNGQADPSFEEIKGFLLASRRSGPRIKYLKNEENEGFSKGYNKTIKYSLGEYYLMLNSDIEVLKNGLTELVAAEDELGGKAVLGGKLIFPDGGSQDSAFHLPTLMGAFKEYFLAKKGSYFMFKPKGEEAVKVEGMVMACLLIPKYIINKVGMLDERTFIFFEDIEYAKRLKKYGLPLYFAPEAKFIHHHGASTKRIGVDKAYELLEASAIAYHGKIYYFLLSLVLRLGQKLGRVKTPVSRWREES